MKIVQIVGARPQFVKYFPVSMAIRNMNIGNQFKNILVHTGQHYDYDMSELFFKELGIDDPDYHLGVGSGNHGKQTGQILQKVEEVLLEQKPSAVVVYGDTNSTVAAALAAVKLHIPVVHIEAGLRSYNKCMPEEINRILTDHSSTILCCPTEIAVKNLYREGFENIANNGKLTACDFDFYSFTSDISSPTIFNVGDVMYDVLLYTINTAAETSRIIDNLNLDTKDYGVLTLHRAENTDDIERLEEIIAFVNEASSGKIVVFPVHPRTKKVFVALKKGFSSNVRLVEPIGYFDMIWLVKNSSIVLTDSGGLQKEAYWLQVPCITLRDETEWVETIQSGWNILYKDYNGTHNPPEANMFSYGDGKAAERVVQILSKMPVFNLTYRKG